MHSEGATVDEIITRYEELSIKDSGSNLEKSTPEKLNVEETSPKIPPGNGHATGHKDKPKGYMCHECVVEAWQGTGATDYMSSPVCASFPEQSTDDDGAQVPNWCSSLSNVDRLLQPVELRPNDNGSTSAQVPATDNHHRPAQDHDSASSQLPLKDNDSTSPQPSANDKNSTTVQSPVDNDGSAFPQPRTTRPLKTLTIPLPPSNISNCALDMPVSPGNCSSTYTAPRPHLSHISLMDNPFEQKINIKTMESYSQCLQKFWTTTAILLGPDFDYNYQTVMERIGDDPSGLQSLLGESSMTSWPLSPTINVGKPRRNILGKELFSSLESMGMGWRWFECESTLQKYINIRVAIGESWDFGYCFERTDGSQHCMIMRVTVGVQDHKKVYEEVVEGPKIAEKLAGVGVAPRFWWCRQHPGSKDHDVKRKARDKRMNERYAEAKKNLDKFLSSNEPQHRFTVEESQKNLFQDLEVREKVEGRYSITTLNTILQLAYMAESLGQLGDAEDWNRELVSRRVKRLGDKSEHTCYARFKLAQVLMKAEKWDEAKTVVNENIAALADYDKTHPLFCRQHIQASAIAMKRRRIDAALEVLQYLRVLEKHHPNDFKNREAALSVIIEAYAFQHRYDKVVEYLPRLIALYVNGFGTKEKKLECQFNLAFSLRRVKKSREAIKVLKESISLAKEIEMTQSDEQLLDIYGLLGQILFEEKEWNPAKFYLESAAKGYRALLGKDHEKYTKIKSYYSMLEAAMQIKFGLSERLARNAKKQALRQALEERETMARGRGNEKVERRLRDLIPGARF